MTQTAAEQAIRDRIRRQGSITFAEFMRLALYHPTGGYYTSTAPFGAAGDYYTSPAAHPAFGALLCVQLRHMWRLIGKPPQFTVAEIGAGNGILAHDIAAYAPRLSPEFARCLRYICIDRYPPASAAANPAIDRLRAAAVPLKGIVGCLLSNELVDAFPVHRFRIVNGAPLEIYVTLDGNGAFAETLAASSTPRLTERISALGFPLPDGFSGEVRLNASRWIGEAAQALAKGFVITIDYGYEAAVLYSPRRRFGTLQTYYRHTEGGSPYQRIGRQDISAHVDFSQLQSDGRAAGLTTIAYTTQAALLQVLGIDAMLRQARTMPLSPRDRSANLMAMRQLINPSGLGGFKALIQAKGVEVAAADIAPPQAQRDELQAPLLSDRHMPLLDGRYPHAAWQAWETPELWPSSEAELR